MNIIRIIKKAIKKFKTRDNPSNYLIREEDSAKIIWERRPIGTFYYEVKEVGEPIKYVGIDNSTGNANVEIFKSRRKCIEWLEGSNEIYDNRD